MNSKFRRRRNCCKASIWPNEPLLIDFASMNKGSILHRSKEAPLKPAPRFVVSFFFDPNEVRKCNSAQDH